MEIHIGASGYSYKEWKGSFYPEKTSPKEMLRFYSEHLGSVEINNTFYRMPTEDLLTSWAEQVPENFILAFKAPQTLTHIKRLRNVESETEYLFKTLSVLGKKLGPILFQFPRSYQADPSILKPFLARIPRTLCCSFEFRSHSREESEILNLLGEKGCCLCVTDSDEDPAHGITVTAPWGYLRLRRSNYTDKDLWQWKEKILSQKWEKAFIFFKHKGTTGPSEALRFQELFRQTGKARGVEEEKIPLTEGDAQSQPPGPVSS